MLNRTISSLILSSFCIAASAATGEEQATAFRAECAKKAATGEDIAIPGADGWLVLRAELRHIGVGPFWGEAAAKVSRASSPEKADPLPAIIDFHEQLKAAGIELILAPVPCKALVNADKLGGPAEGRLDTVHQEFYQQLAAKGVKVLDLADAFAKEKAKGPLLYCKTDTHWSPYACELTAKLIKERLGAPAWLRATPGAFTTTTEKRTIVGDLTDGKGSEELPIRVVTGADEPGRPSRRQPYVSLSLRPGAARHRCRTRGPARGRARHHCGRDRRARFRRHPGARESPAPRQGGPGLSRGQEGSHLVLCCARVHREHRLVAGAVLVRRQAGWHDAVNKVRILRGILSLTRE